MTHALMDPIRSALEKAGLAVQLNLNGDEYWATIGDGSYTVRLAYFPAGPVWVHWLYKTPKYTPVASGSSLTLDAAALAIAKRVHA